METLECTVNQKLAAMLAKVDRLVHNPDSAVDLHRQTLSRMFHNISKVHHRIMLLHMLEHHMHYLLMLECNMQDHNRLQ